MDSQNLLRCSGKKKKKSKQVNSFTISFPIIDLKVSHKQKHPFIYLTVENVKMSYASFKQAFLVVQLEFQPLYTSAFFSCLSYIGAKSVI